MGDEDRQEPIDESKLRPVPGGYIDENGKFIDAEDHLLDKIIRSLDEEEKKEQEELVYDGPIPTNLRECVDILKSELDEKSIDLIKKTSLDDFRTTAHFGMGMTIRNRYLYHGGAPINIYDKDQELSPLATHLRDRGVFHEDDMSSLILTALHNDLTSGGFDETELISRFAPYGEYGEPKPDGN